MIEPEIAFADLSADAASPKIFSSSSFAALLDERKDDMAFFEKFVDPECIKRLDESSLEVRAHGLRRRDRALEKSGNGEVRVPRVVGHQSAERARALLDGEGHQRAGRRRELSEGHQGVLHAPQSRRQNGRGDGRARTGIGEIIGGSQREERLEVLDGSIVEMKLDPKDYGWYRDLRRYGTVPHAGFGLGFERRSST